jgi:hypothetical protein
MESLAVRSTAVDRLARKVQHLHEFPPVTRIKSRSQVNRVAPNLYGKEDAFELAVYCRRKRFRELGLPTVYYSCS